MRHFLRSHRASSVMLSCLAVALLVVLAVPPAFAADLVAHLSNPIAQAVVGGGGISLALIAPVTALTSREITSANTIPAGSTTRGTRGVWYDTQPYVSTTTLSLSFFGAINADKSLSNSRGNGGTLPNGWAFLPITMGVDVLGRASLAGASTQVGILDDIAQLVLSGRGFAEVKVGNFPLPEIPISFLHGSGGPFGGIGASLTAPNAVQFGTNGVQDGGFDIRGSYTLTSDTPLTVRLNWPAALTLNQTPLNLRFWFLGDWQTPLQG